MPPDPTLAVPPDQHLDTAPSEIGQVAPSLASPRFFNTLVVRPEFRISLRLGSVENLFANEPATEAGRMERLQVLGLFYFPLKHKRALAALRGTPSPSGSPKVTSIAPRVGTWNFFKTKVLGGASDAEADAALQNALQSRLISGAAIPPFSKSPGDVSALPTPAPEGVDPTPDNWAKIRLPGTWAFMTSTGGRNLNADGVSTMDFGQPTFEMESRVLRDNPVMHKIPLIATVEKRDPGTTEWVPEPNASVFFQLIKPYELAGDADAPDPKKLPFDAAAPCNAQFNRPPLRESSIGLARVPAVMDGATVVERELPAIAAKGSGAGPRQLTTSEVSRTPAPADSPWGTNCLADRGGFRPASDTKNNSDVQNKVFLTSSTPGFNESVPGRKLPHTPFLRPLPGPADGKHPHCVTAKTNADGEAGVIFVPARMGGDRYRLRAYIGPPTIPGADGTGPTAVSVDTGSFVVWRNIRISRYVQQPLGTPEAGTLFADAQAAPYNMAAPANYLAQTGSASRDASNNLVVEPLPNADFAPEFVPNVNSVSGQPRISDRFIPQYARAFCEVELDPGVGAPEVMSQADWAAARQQAFDDAVVGIAKLKMDIDARLLFCMDVAGINVNNSVVHVPMRSPEAYNATLAANSPKRIRMPGTRQGNAQNTIGNLDTIFWNFLMPGFLRSLADDGFPPGLTIVQGGGGATWQLLRRTPADPNNRTWLPGNSGVALEYRGNFVWFGAPTYRRFPYDFTSNVCHECGHNLGREHGPRHLAGGMEPTKHDPIAQSICVMSYEACEGQYCAKCLFGFRGWDIRPMTSV